MTIRVLIIVFFFQIVLIASGNAQVQQSYTTAEISSLRKGSDARTVITNAIKRGANGNSYHLMGDRRVIGGVNALLRVKWDDNLIKQQRDFVDSIISAAQPLDQLNSTQPFSHDYVGWVSLTEGQEYQKEVPLYESYSFFYITEFLYLLKKNGWVNKNEENQKWWEEKVLFVEENVWEKWRNRSKVTYGKYNTYFLRSRTHMGSHWAGIALYLSEITSNGKIRKQAKKLYRSYDRLLKRNFEVINNQYVWNRTYDKVLFSGAIPSSEPLIQDTSHGNNVISYIIAAYDLGNSNWTSLDINRLINTFKNGVYDSVKNTLNTYINGTTESEDRGRFFLGDGWVKLARYDEDLLELFKRFSDNDEMMQVSNQEFQFNCNLREAEHYLKNHKS